MAFKFTKEEAADFVRYSRAIEEASDWLDSLSLEQRDAFDEKSEKWQESDAGQAVSVWVENLEEAASQFSDAKETFVNLQTKAQT